MNTTTTCGIGGCVSDHTAATSVHFGKSETIPDANGKPVGVELHYNSSTGQALVHVGEHELTLLGALDLTRTVTAMVDAGLMLPGAIGDVSAEAVQ